MQRFWCLLALALVACEETDPIVTQSVSPDERWVAMVAASGRLGVLDLTARPDANAADEQQVYSDAAFPDVAWHPDSMQLAFVEHHDGGPVGLRTLSVDDGRATSPVLSGPDWKAQPVWLTTHTLAFLSTREADHVRVWTVDIESRCAAVAIDRGHDVTGLWKPPQRDGLILRSLRHGVPELYWWPRGADEMVRLTDKGDARNPDDPPHARGPVAFSADGATMVCVETRRFGRDLVLYDLECLEERDRLSVTAPVGGVAVLGDGRVAAAVGREAWLWRPDAPWWRASVRRRTLRAGALGAVARRGAHGAVWTLAGNVLCVAERAGRPDRGRLWMARRTDAFRLAALRARGGDTDSARRMIENLHRQSPRGSRLHLRAALGLARLARERGAWRRADQWLREAAQDAPPGGAQARAIREERLAVACFDASNDTLARWLLRGGDDEASPMSGPLAEWTRGLSGREGRAWRRIVGDLRARRLPGRLGRAVDALAKHAPTTTTLRGLALILDGAFEPIERLGVAECDLAAELLERASFRAWLERAFRSEIAVDDEWRRMLWEYWIERGDATSARAMLARDLETGREPTLDLHETLIQFLQPEETDLWVERVVTRVVLHPDLATSLSQTLNAPADRAAFALADAKAGLIEGDCERVAARLDVARATMDEGDGSSESLHEPTWWLYRAKLHERSEQWPRAREAYEVCLKWMESHPRDWGTLPFDLAMFKELLARPSREHEDIRSFLHTIHAMGDPLVDPSSDPATLRTGLANLATLRRVWRGRRLRPWLDFASGRLHAQLRERERALDWLTQARRHRPPPALRRCILLEEAALRAALGHHALAARLYGQLTDTPLPMAAWAMALRGQIEAEAACGLTASPHERRNDRVERRVMNDAWREWFGIPGLSVWSDSRYRSVEEGMMR